MWWECQPRWKLSMHSWLRLQYCIFSWYFELTQQLRMHLRKRKGFFVFFYFYFFWFCPQHAHRSSINVCGGLDHKHPITSKRSKKSNHRLNNLGMFVGKVFVSDTKNLWFESSCCIKNRRHFPLFSWVHAVSFCCGVFLGFFPSAALCFPSLFTLKERRGRSIRNIKAKSMRSKIRDLCLSRALAAHLHSACLLLCLYIPLRTGDMCHFASFAEGKRKKVSFIWRQEPSQSGMPNWHHTLVLSALSCRSCTATGLFNYLTGLSWF